MKNTAPKHGIRRAALMAAFGALAAITSARPSLGLPEGKLAEDFSGIAMLDYGATSGFWNIEDRVAEAARVANTEVARPISFGDGSDGELKTSDGYAFNTDTHPNGYDFTLIDITGGAITVAGSHPLVIRSLTTVNITPAILVSGSVGAAGVGGGAGAAAAATTQAAGGAGGVAAGAGAAGKKQDGTADTNGSGGDGTPVAASGADFDTAIKFVSGSGGGGGDGGGGTGGGGGAAGGSIRIVAAGNISVGAITASGGAGGAGVGGGGDGGGGAGGNVWLQTLKTLSTSSDPAVAGGGGALAGALRGDSISADRPAWAVGAGNYNTDKVPGNRTYVVQSKAYDLGTVNAAFVQNPSVEKTLYGGQVTVEYAASADGAAFSDFAENIFSLGNKGYRYLKFRITIKTGGADDVSPRVRSIVVPYQDLDFKLAGGCMCGSIDANGMKPRMRDHIAAAASGLSWGLFCLVAFLIARYGLVRTERRPDDRTFPA